MKVLITLLVSDSQFSVLFWHSVSLCSPGPLEAHDDLLPQPLYCWKYSMCHHAPLSACFRS